MSKKSKYKVVAPVRTYNGLSGGVYFTQGVGYTNDDHLAKWFKSRGYDVGELKEEAKEEPKEEATVKIPKEIVEEVIDSPEDHEEDPAEEEDEGEGEADDEDPKPAKPVKVKRAKK